MTVSTLRPCLWGFDLGPTWKGFTDGTTWNGFDNVWVDPEVRADVVAWLRKDAGNNPDAMQEADDFAALPVEDGLVCFGWGYAILERETVDTLAAVLDRWKVENPGLRITSLSEAGLRASDENLTLEQRAWLSEFSYRAALAEEQGEATILWQAAKQSA